MPRISITSDRSGKWIANLNISQPRSSVDIACVFSRVGNLRKHQIDLRSTRRKTQDWYFDRGDIASSNWQ